MSALRIKGAEGVIIDSTYFLELPKAQTKHTTPAERPGMIRYNSEWKSFEGVISFDDGSVSYRRFANLDQNGQLLTSQLPDSITSGAHYIGTYSPIIDDIDPPVGGANAKLPIPSTDNSGDYFIVRGIYDVAQAHYSANKPTSTTVIFSPTQSNWIEIKYYIGDDPANAGAKLVIAAFARIIVANIPATGHEGLQSLSTDANLTTAFTASVDRTTELALTDGDWVISTGTVQQRLRQNRVSISAGAVSFDRTLSTSTNRSFLNTSGTVQTVLDNVILDGLRRTGDTMYDDGSQGGGRLGLVYGSVSSPSIAFNNTNDSGLNPPTWSDTSTGLFHPGIGSIGFTTTGIERFRVSEDQIIVFPKLHTDPSVPNILFSGNGNNQLGISAVADSLYYVSDNQINVVMSKNSTLFNGSILVNANATIGTNASNTLTANASTTFNANTTHSTGTSLNFAGTNVASVNKSDTSLNFNMTAFDDVTILDGTAIRTKFNRYGVQLPVLNPIDNTVGVDGMIAYSVERNTVMQKSNGQWTTVSGGGVEQAFTAASWVLNGDNYTLTINGSNIQSIKVQESVNGNFNQVEVDSIVISPTNAVLSIPALPNDLRFSGRVIITYR